MVVHRSYSRISLPDAPSSLTLTRSPTVIGGVFPEVQRSPSRVSFSSSSRAVHGPATHVSGSYGSVPVYTDSYPYVRYTHTSGYNASAGMVTSSRALPRASYSSREQSMGRYVDSYVHQYLTTLSFQPYYSSRSNYSTRPSLRDSLYGPAPVVTTSVHRSSPSYSDHYIGKSRSLRPAASSFRHCNIDAAMDLYKKSYLTSSSLSKYWLSSNYWQNKREQGWSQSMDLSRNYYHSIPRMR